MKRDQSKNKSGIAFLVIGIAGATHADLNLPLNLHSSRAIHSDTKHDATNQAH